MNNRVKKNTSILGFFSVILSGAKNLAKRVAVILSPPAGGRRIPTGSFTAFRMTRHKSHRIPSIPGIICNILNKIPGMKILPLFFIFFFFLPFRVFASELSNQFTLELWVKPDTSVASKAILGKAEEMRIFTDASGYPGCQFKVSTWQTASTATTALTLGAWSHVACAYNKATLKLYVNGVEKASTALTSTVDDTAANFKIGQDDSASTTYTNFIGTTDQFQAYNYARTQKQIVQDMEGGHPAVGVSEGIRQPAVAHYKFDEGYGTTANNSGSGGSTLNGTLTNMSSPPTATSGWTNSGKFSKALNFDGTTNWVDLGTGLDQNNELTLSAWINTTTVAAGTREIITNCNAGAALQDYAFEINRTAGKLDAFWGNTLILTGNTTLLPNTWYHAVMVRSGTTGNWKVTLYLNGKSDGSTTTAVNPSATNERTAIGRAGNYSGFYFSGTIDDVKIYDYALNPEEVKVDFNQGSSERLGSLSTTSTNTASNASTDSYCPPGQGTACVAPVAEWKMDEGTGSYAYDTSGNGNTGTLTGATHLPTWTVGKIGKGLKFDGTDDYVGMGSFTTLTQWTASMWIKPNTVSGYQELLGGNTNLYGGLYLHGNKFQVYYAGADRDSVGTIPANTWTYVTAIVDADSLDLYINGVFDKTYAVTPSFGGTPKIGVNVATGNTEWYSGFLDQVRVYNYARTPAQIAWDYNKGAPVAHWKFDEASGTTANDSSGNAQTGTVTSANFVSGKLNNALAFNGTTSFVSATVSKSVNAISFWMQQSTTANKSIIDLGGGYTVTVASNAITAGGFSSPTIYVDGKATTAITDTNWHHIAITTATAFTAGSVTLGKVSSAFFTGTLDDIKLFNYPLTSLQVKTLYNDGAVSFKPATAGGSTSYLLNDQFTTARSAGAVNGTQAEPVGGVRTVTDTNSKLSITGGKLSVATGGLSAGDPGLVYPTISRSAGKLILATLTPTTTLSSGFSSGATGVTGDGVYFGGSNVLYSRDYTTGKAVGEYVSGTSYAVATVAKNTGVYTFIKGGIYSNWTLLYIGSSGTYTPMYPGIRAEGTNGEGTADNIRIPTATWLPTPLAYDSFTRGAGSVGVTEARGPDGQNTPQLAWVGSGATVNASGKLVITPTEESEMLTNGGFEAPYTNGLANGWTSTSSPSVSQSGDAHSGTSAQQFTGTEYRSRIEQIPTVSSGLWCKASVWIKRISGTNGNTKFTLNDNPNYPETKGFTENSYTQYILTTRRRGVAGFFFRPADTFSTTVYDTIVVDDASLKPLTLPSLFSTVSTSDTDIIASADVVMTAGTQAGVVTNLNDAATPTAGIVAYVTRGVTDATSTVTLDKFTGATTWTNVQAATTVTYVAGATLRVITYHSDPTHLKVRVYYNNALVGTEQEVTDTAIISNTKHGLFSTYSGNTFDNFTLFPRGTGNEYSGLNQY